MKQITIPRGVTREERDELIRQIVAKIIRDAAVPYRKSDTTSPE